MTNKFEGGCEVCKCIGIRGSIKGETIANCGLVSTMLACVSLVVAGAFSIHILMLVSSGAILTSPLVMFLGIVMDERQEKKQMVVHEIKKGDGRYINGEYVLEYNGAEYSFPNEAAAMGEYIDAVGDLHRNRLMVDVVRECNRERSS